MGARLNWFDLKQMRPFVLFFILTVVATCIVVGLVHVPERIPAIVTNETVVFERAPSEAVTPKTIIITYKHIDLIPRDIVTEIADGNPGYTIELYGDAECRQYLEEAHGLGAVFDSIPDGPIRADYFRIHRLLKGGIYLDVDVVLSKPLDEILKGQETECVIPKVNYSKLYNPCFIAAPPDNHIIRSAIATYANIVQNVKYSYWNWSVVYIITAVTQKLKLETGPMQEFCPHFGRFASNLYKCTVRMKDETVLHSRRRTYDARNHAFH